MINLSKIELDTNQQKLLEKGLNFIPTPKTITNTPILEAASKFSRRLKLAYNFRNSKFHNHQKFVPKSNWVPDDKNIPRPIHETIDKIKIDISKLSTSYHKSNLPKAEIDALKNIRNIPDIVIKAADKGSATVIMDKQSYINEGLRQLNDTRYYEKIENPIYPATSLKVIEILYDLLQKKMITEKQFQFLKPPNEPRPRIFYMLPKIHKPLEKWPASNMPQGRPIISDCSSESYAVSEYIDHFLKPLACKHKSYLKDTTDFLNKLKNVKIDENSLIVTLDVESMYTNIDHESGLAAVRKAFIDNPDPNRPDQQILELLELSLKNNDFQFNGETYIQTKGTAMGKKYAPSYANIFMAYFETEAMDKCALLPSVYFRFLDDIFMIWNHGRKRLNTYLEIMNTHHAAVKLTASIQEKSNDYLDVTVFKGPLMSSKGILDTKIYFKPTDTHQLLHKASFHPKHTFKGILKSQIMRFYRICSQKSDFDSTCTLLFKVLKGRGYSGRFLRDIKTKTLLDMKSGDSIQPPCLTPEPEIEFSAEPCGILPFCHVCPDFQESDIVTSNTTKFTFKIRQNLNCGSRNIIYLVECKECNKQYIGQTSRSLRRRAFEHKRDIEHYETRKTSVSTHFNTGACMRMDFRITPIFECPIFEDVDKTTKIRLDIEQYFISSFKCYQPYGLNVAIKKYKDIPGIHFIVPYSKLGQTAARIVKSHYENLQESLPEIFGSKFITAFSRNRNLKDLLVSAKIK